jgi:hypothetical protein
MKNITIKSLNKNWQYCAADINEDFSSPQLDDTEWAYVTDVGFDALMRAPSDMIWLRQRFDLSLTDVCMRYFLRCDGCFVPMTIYLRGRVVAIYRADEALDVDITDYVSLDDNVLALSIAPLGSGFDVNRMDMYLQPIACDDLT